MIFQTKIIQNIDFFQIDNVFRITVSRVTIFCTNTEMFWKKSVNCGQGNRPMSLKFFQNSLNLKFKYP